MEHRSDLSKEEILRGIAAFMSRPILRHAEPARNERTEERPIPLSSQAAGRKYLRKHIGPKWLVPTVTLVTILAAILPVILSYRWHHASNLSHVSPPTFGGAPPRFYFLEAIVLEGDYAFRRKHYLRALLKYDYTMNKLNVLLEDSALSSEEIRAYRDLQIIIAAKLELTRIAVDLEHLRNDVGRIIGS